MAFHFSIIMTINVKNVNKIKQVLNLEQIKMIKDSDFKPYNFDYDTFFSNYLGYRPLKDKIKKYPFDIEDAEEISSDLIGNKNSTNSTNLSNISNISTSNTNNSTKIDAANVSISIETKQNETISNESSSVNSLIKNISGINNTNISNTESESELDLEVSENVNTESENEMNLDIIDGNLLNSTSSLILNNTKDGNSLKNITKIKSKNKIPKNKKNSTNKTNGISISSIKENNNNTTQNMNLTISL